MTAIYFKMGKDKQLTKMEHMFHKINREFIKMNKKDTKYNTEVVFALLNKLIKIMRRIDKLFDSMSPSLEYLGSYFDRLRVGKPTEYDINIIFSVPINRCRIKLDATNSTDGHTNIIMPSEFRRLSTNPATANKGFVETISWCNREYCISVLKFRTWMQSVLDNAMNTLPLENGKRIIKIKNKNWKVSTKQSGPVNTLLITCGDKCIDIDLVPTFSFELPMQPCNSLIEFKKVSDTHIKTYFVVPKPNNDEYSWRISFPYQERHLMKFKNNMKSTIRLIKHFRDIQEFTKLSSYYIKTLFLWECSKVDTSFWETNSLTHLVIHMLKKIRDCLNDRKIPNFWCPSHNLIRQIREETCENWSNRITRIINKLETLGPKNVSIVQKYFTKRVM